MWAACVDKYRLKEVDDFVGLECSTISIAWNSTAEAGSTKTADPPTK